MCRMCLKPEYEPNLDMLLGQIKEEVMEAERKHAEFVAMLEKNLWMGDEKTDS